LIGSFLEDVVTVGHRGRRSYHTGILIGCRDRKASFPQSLLAQLVDATPSHRNDFSKGGVYGPRKTGQALR
jgi:hypothetical protein